MEKLCYSCKTAPHAPGRSYCQECYRRKQRDYYEGDKEKRLADMKEYAALNKEKRKAYMDEYIIQNKARFLLSARQSRVQAKYGLTLEEAEALRQRQCEVCGAPPPNLIDHVVDGSWVGVLCNRCNANLEKLSPEHPLYRAALEYWIRTRT